MAVEKIEVCKNKMAIAKRGDDLAIEAAARRPVASGDGTNPPRTLATVITEVRLPRINDRMANALAAAAANKKMRCHGATSGKMAAPTPAAAPSASNTSVDLVREDDI